MVYCQKCEHQIAEGVPFCLWNVGATSNGGYQHGNNAYGADPKQEA